MAKVKDLQLSFDQRPNDVLTGKIVVVNLIAQSEGLEGMTFQLSSSPKREITFVFPPLADNEDYTATIFLAPKRAIAPLVTPPPVENVEPIAVEPVIDPLPTLSAAEESFVALEEVAANPSTVEAKDLLPEIDAIKAKRVSKKAKAK